MRDSHDGSGLKKFSSAALAVLGVLVLLIGLIGAILMVLGRQSSQLETYFKLAGEQRLLARSLVNEAQDAARGREAAFAKLKESRDRFEQALNDQKSGNAALGLNPAPAVAQPNLAALEKQWTPMKAEVDALLATREALALAGNFVPLLDNSLSQINTLFDDIAKSLASNRSDARQVYQVTKQLQIGEQIAGDLRRMLNETGASVNTAAERFGRNVRLFGQVLKGMQDGDARTGVERITLPESVGKLTTLNELFRALDTEASRIAEKAPEIVKAQNAAQSINAQSGALVDTVGQLVDQYAASGRHLTLFGIPLSYPIIYLLGALTLIFIIMLFFLQNRESQQRLRDSEQRKQETEEQNHRNQDAILRLLDELGNLAEGDLTVQASVTEDITGAIADSVNYAIEALRDLVSTINNTSSLVASAVQETSAIADRLAKSSEIQARQIESASSTVTQMSRSMDEVSAKTASSAEVAEKSVGIAHEGGDRVRRTIHGMDTIREHIQDTSKRIKRLGESSQEIGDIVALINDIADQTNILALNAAIQASAAGDAGRGFAVVADEVQRLAERSSNATKRIEMLVKTIQADTNEAVISMEKSTSEVVGGAGLAQKAGEALEEIEKVSASLAELIDEISKSSGQVSEMASRVAGAMTSINDITGQTAESSVATASAIGKMHRLAQELRQSVTGFRLPG